MPRKPAKCPSCKTRAIVPHHKDQVCRECYDRRQIPFSVEDVNRAALSGEVLEPRSEFTEHWDQLKRYIGLREQQWAKSIIAPEIDGKRSTVILHLTDLHIPYCDKEALAQAISDNRGASHCVIGGDLFNAGAASRFIASNGEGFSNPRDEIAEATATIAMIASHFPDVVIQEGNHVARLRKYFAARIPSYLMFLVETNPIAFIVEGLRAEGVTNVRAVEPLIPELPSSNWATMIGDCAFTHAETHSKIPMRPAENVATFFARWRHALPVMPRAIVQEHNHRGGKMFDSERNVLLLHAPCLSRDQSYQFEPTIKYGPNQLGYVRVVQRDGVTDVNASNFYLL